MTGDYQITVSGNIFDHDDRNVFTDMLDFCKRRGFNRYVTAIEVEHSPWLDRPVEGDAPKENEQPQEG